MFCMYYNEVSGLPFYSAEVAASAIASSSRLARDPGWRLSNHPGINNMMQATANAKAAASCS